MNKGALNIAFSRLNLHTQLIFVLATILTFQIINRTLKSLKLLKTLLCFKWVWQTVSKTSKADFFWRRRETGKPILALMNIPDVCCLDVSGWVWYFLFLVQFNSIQGLSFAALLCWIAKQGKKCGAKIWFNNQPFNPLTLPSRNLAYHLSTFCSVRTELMWTPHPPFDWWWSCNIVLPWSSTFNISKIIPTHSLSRARSFDN